MKYLYILLGLVLFIGLFTLVEPETKTVYTTSDKLTFTTSSDYETQEQEVISSCNFYVAKYMMMFSVGASLIIEYRSIAEIIDIKHVVFKSNKQYPRGCITELA